MSVPTLVFRERHILPSPTVQFARNRIRHVTQQLLLFLKIFSRSPACVGVKPVRGLVYGSKKLPIFSALYYIK